jgi:hypothetical protein
MLYLVLTARASVGFKHQALSLFEKRLFSAMNVCISGFDVDWHTGWDYVCPSFSLHSVCAVLRIRDRYWKNRPTLCHNGPTIFVLSFPTLSSCSLSPCWWWWWSLSSSPLPLAQRDVLELKLDGRLYTFCCRLAVAFPFSSANFLYFFSPPLYKLSPHRTASSISFMLFIWLDFITSPIASDLCIRRWFLERLLHYMYLAVSPMPFSLPSFFFGFVWGGREGGVCAPFHHQHSMHILRIVWYWRLFGDIFNGNFFKEGLLVWKPRPLRLWPVGSVFSSLTSLTQVHFSLSYLCVVSGSFSSPACVPVPTNCQYFSFFLDFRMWFRVSIILWGGLVWVQNECCLRSRSLVTLTPFLCSLNQPVQDINFRHIV